MCAAPPDDAMAAGKHVARGEVAIFLCVPFLCEEWIFCGEVIFSGDGKAAAAIGTACAAAGAGVHGGLPVVAVFTCPPDFFLAAVADGLRGEGKIFFADPLAEKIGAVVALAKACKGFSHGLHLLSMWSRYGINIPLRFLKTHALIFGRNYWLEQNFSPEIVCALTTT